MIRLGFHMSIAGSVANAPENAAERGYGCFQIFTASSRSWKQDAPPKEECEAFAESVKRHGLVAFAHMPYIANLSSANRQVWEKSVASLAANVRNCSALGIHYLVAHLGSHLGKGMDSGIERTCSALGKALEARSDVMVLLENSAGYRNSVGSSFGDLERILDALDLDRIGVCFDTCHAFAAGYDISNEKGVEDVAAELSSRIGASRLKLVHLNDAKYPLGSGLDRHWHIGEGCIGRSGFLSLFRNNLFDHGSFVLETPGSRGDGDDGRNMGAVEEMIRTAAHKPLPRP